MGITFNRDMFVETKGSQFKLTAGGGQTVDIELIEISDLKESQYQQSFSLLFLLPETYTAEQGLFDIEHEQLGAMQLFLAPVGIDNGRLQMEAVFNLLREKDVGS